MTLHSPPARNASKRRPGRSGSGFLLTTSNAYTRSASDGVDVLLCVPFRRCSAALGPKKLSNGYRRALYGATFAACGSVSVLRSYSSGKLARSTLALAFP
jgi:hypothetical protein